MILEENTFQGLFQSSFSKGKADILWEHYDETLIAQYTYGEYYSHILGMAKSLSNKLSDIPADSWIGIKLPNQPLWSALFWACLYAGYNIFILDNACNDKYLGNVSKNSGIKAIITSDDPKLDGVTFVSGQEIIDSSMEEEWISPNRFADKIALGTSGTTGTPKIFVHTGKSICAQINNIMERYAELDKLHFLLQQGEKNMFTMFPNHHIAALMSNIIYERLHGKVVTVEKNTITSITEAIKRGNVQIAYSVPMVWDSIVKNILKKHGSVNKELFQSIVGNNLKFVIMGAARASAETMSLLNDAGIFSSQAYGMTEIGSLTSNVCSLISDRTDGCVGSVNSEVYQAMLYLEDGSIAEEGIGELMVSGDIIYEYMLIDGKEIKPELFMNKYFLTGDRVEIRQKKLYILGRNKDVIVNNSGENIYPDELEEYFAKLTADAERMVILGVKEKPVMVLKLKDDHTLDDSVIVNICNYNKKLPVYKRIRAVYKTSKEIPVTSSGKVKKLLIRTEIEDGNNNYQQIEMKG
ncbi:MAG: acyl--CoA ligase [Pseudobutyrivibrio sp.]|nr:acyl--CoA ligase [Pseudobutyrivibrio sp.]